MDIGGLGDKAKDLLNSEKGEQGSDKALDKAAQLAKDRSGGSFDEQIGKGRDLADDRVGQADEPRPGG